MFFFFYFTTDRNLPFVEYAGEKNFLCWLRELVAVRAVFKTLRGDGACKALSLGEVAAAVRLRIAGFGKALPNKIPMGQNERNAKSGTSVESCSLLLQASLHHTTDIFSAKKQGAYL